MSRPSPTLLAAVVAGLLSIALPLGGGAYRDDHLAAAGLVLGAVLISAALLHDRHRERVEAALRDRAFQAVLAAAALVLLDTAVRAATSPIEDAARAKVTVAVFAAAAFLASAAISAASERAARMLTDGAVLGIAAVAVLSIGNAGATLSEGLVWPFANHAQLGGLFAAGAVLAFRLPGRDGVGARDLMRLGAAAFLGVAAAATQSRSAFLALAVAALASAAPSVRRRTVVAISAALVAAVVWVGAEGRWNPVRAAGTGPVQDRLAVWSASAKLAAESPLTGAGLGTYGSAIWKHTPEAVGGAIENAHSHPLEVLAERGLPGAIALGALLLLAFRCALAPVPGAMERSLPRRATFAAGALLAQSLVDVSLATSGLVLLTAALLGTACGVAARARGSAQAALGRQRRLPLAISAAGLASIAIAGHWLALTSDRARSQQHAERGDREVALEAARASLARFPVDRVSARRLAESGDLASYERLVALDVYDPYAALGIAVAHETAGRIEEAEAEIRRARALFPLGHAPRRALVDFLARSGRIGEALEEAAALAAAHPTRAADAAISVATIVGNPLLAEPLAPQAPADRRRVAEWMVAHGAPEAALRLLEGANDPASILAAARASTSAGRKAEARALLWPISADPAAALLLADLASSATEIEEAVAALGPHDRDPQVAAKIVALLDRAGRADEAEAKLEALLAAAPDAVPLLEVRLERRTARGDLSGAMEDAQRVIELRPHEARGRLALARLYERRGLVAGARDLYAEALQVAPENAEARAALARLSNR